MLSKSDKAVVPAWGPPEVVEDVEQGSDDWLELRRGIPTASNFACVGRDADSKTRKEYLHHLAGELLSGRIGESKKFPALERGKEMEPRARDAYERKNIVEVHQVGFIRRKLPSGRYVGCSPDGLVKPLKLRKGLEIKTMAPHAMVAMLDRGAAGVPPAHVAQVVGTLLVGDLAEVDLSIYYDGMPIAPQFTMLRSEKELKELADAIEVFDDDLNKLVVRIRKMGGK